MLYVVGLDERRVILREVDLTVGGRKGFSKQEQNLSFTRWMIGHDLSVAEFTLVLNALDGRLPAIVAASRHACSSHQTEKKLAQLNSFRF